MIQVHNLSRNFTLESGQTLVAVDHVSFKVPAGEVYGLLGPNGAGKTTTLRMLLGLLRPTAGWAEIDGIRSSDAPDEVKRRVGLVSASAGVYQYQTIREVLEYFGDLYGMPFDAVAQRISVLATEFEITNLLDRQCVQLSTGQKQRLNLVRALLHSPPVVLLDEPTLGLDIRGSRIIYDFVETLRREGKAVIICTHHLDDAERLCTRFGLMDGGRLVREGTLSDLRSAFGAERLVDMFLKLSDRGGASETLSEAAGGIQPAFSPTLDRDRTPIL
jgi:sodium transport system ATP-binding protein